MIKNHFTAYFILSVFVLSGFFLMDRPAAAQVFGGFADDDDDFIDDADDFGNAPAAKPAQAPRNASAASDLSAFIEPGTRQFGDAGVEAILASEPKTAQELVRAGKVIASLGRMEIAKALFQKAAAAKPTDAEMYDMVMEHGQSFFAALAKDARYAPEGKTLGEMVLKSMNRRFEDEAVVKSVIKRLWGTDVAARGQAMTELQGKSDVSLPILLTSLVDDEMKNGRSAIEAILLTFGETATDAIAAVLDSGDLKLKTACVKILAMQAVQENPEALNYLFLAAGNRDAESEPLRKAAYAALESVLRRNLPEDGEEGEAVKKFVDEAVSAEMLRLCRKLAVLRSSEKTDTSVVDVWQWNAETKRPVPVFVSAEHALSMSCYRFARALYRMHPESPLARREYLRNTLEQVILTQGTRSEKLLKTPEFQSIMKEFPPATIEALLDFCLKEKAYLAATGAAVILGETGNESLLAPKELRKSPSADSAVTQPLAPIVAAMNTPHRGVRFAAMEAVMKWDPKKPYSGSYLMVDNLAWFLSTAGRPRVLVSGESTTDAAMLGGRFLAFGYHFDAVGSGKDMLARSRNSSDYAFLLISMETQNPTPDFLAQSIRRDTKSADIPIIFVARAEDVRAAERLAAKTPKSVWFPRPATEADVEHMLLLAGRLQDFTPVTDVQRLDETRKSLTWAGKIVSAQRGGWTQKIAGTHTVNYAAGAEKPAVPEVSEAPKAAETPKIAEAPSTLKAPVLAAAPAPAPKEKPHTIILPPAPAPQRKPDPTLTALAAMYQPKNNASANVPPADVPAENIPAEAPPGALPLEIPEPAPAPAPAPIPAPPKETPAPAAPVISVPEAPPFQDIYDISKLQTPVLNLMSISAYTTESADVLAWFGTPISQTTLMNFASSGTQDLDLRKKCVRALKVSVDHFGILMNGTEVARQYDIYNETAADDDDSRLIRDAILTVLER